MKLKNVTYLGRRAKVADISTRGNHTTGTGERVSILVWIDDATEDNGGHAAGTVVASHIKGDGRRRDFQRFAEKTFTNLDDALNWAESRLGTRVADRAGKQA